MRRGFGLALAVLMVLASISLAGSQASATGSGGFVLSWVAGRPNVVSGTPVASNDIAAQGPIMDGSGGMYLFDSGQGYVYHLAASGVLTIIAGNGGTSAKGAPEPGPATSTEVHPKALTVDGAGTVFIADYRGYVLAVSSSGSLSIIAGSGGVGDTPVPGPATASPIYPNALALDAAGDLYIGERDYVVKVTPDGTLSVVAGNGYQASNFPPVAGPATSSPVSASALAFDGAGNLYIGDSLGWLLKVTPGGTLSVVAGNGNAYSNPVPGPASQSPVTPISLIFDSAGNLFIGDFAGFIDKIAPDGTLSIFAGRGGQGTPQPGPAASSEMVPSALAFNTDGSLDFSDAGSVWKVAAGTLSVVVVHNQAKGPTPGPATSSLMDPVGVAVGPGGNLYIADPSGYIYKVAQAGTLSIIAGTGSGGDPIPGPATLSPIAPYGIAVDQAGNVYATDGNRVVKINTSGVLSVIAGNGSDGPVVPGPARQSPIVADEGIALDHAGDLYIAVQHGYILKITPAGTLSIFAGIGDYQDAPIPGPAKSSPFEADGVAVDSVGNVYIADPRGYVDKVTPSGVLSIFAGNGHTAPAPPIPGPATNSPIYPSGIAVDASDNVYFNDANGYLERVDPFGTLSVIAGNGLSPDVRVAPNPGPATSTHVFGEEGVAVDAGGTVYMSDFQYVVKLQAPALTTVTPTVTGTARVGDTLTAHVGTWGPGTVALRYQWLANGSPITGATNPTYSATPSVYGRALSVRVSGYEDGYSATPATSTPSAKVALGIITELSRPYLSGDLMVGHTLTVHPGTWAPSGVTLHYRWLRDGRVFTRITTTPQYRLTRTDLGHRISAQVIVTKWGYTSRAATTSTVRAT